MSVEMDEFYQSEEIKEGTTLLRKQFDNVCEEPKNESMDETNSSNENESTVSETFNEKKTCEESSVSKETSAVDEKEVGGNVNRSHEEMITEFQKNESILENLRVECASQQPRVIVNLTVIKVADVVVAFALTQTPHISQYLAERFDVIIPWYSIVELKTKLAEKFQNEEMYDFIWTEVLATKYDSSSFTMLTKITSRIVPDKFDSILNDIKCHLDAEPYSECILKKNYGKRVRGIVREVRISEIQATDVLGFCIKLHDVTSSKKYKKTRYN